LFVLVLSGAFAGAFCPACNEPADRVAAINALQSAKVMRSFFIFPPQERTSTEMAIAD
jgi:hypothetical protein